MAKSSQEKNKNEAAVELFAAGHNCAQSVLCTFCPDLGFAKETAMRLATGFGAGMARKQEVCGAVTGGIMVIGLKHGQSHEDNKTAMELTYRLTRELIARFIAKHGSCLCRELLNGCDLTSEVGKKQYKDDKLSEKICSPCVADTVCILEDIL